MKVRIAKEKDIQKIYKIFASWKVNQRLMGLKSSIENKLVYVFIEDKKVVGFCRFQFNVSFDYLNFSEIVIHNSIRNKKLKDEFFNMIDYLFTSLGYIKAKISPTKVLWELFHDRWVFTDKRFVKAKFKNMIHEKRIYTRELQEVDIKIFGINLKKYRSK